MSRARNVVDAAPSGVYLPFAGTTAPAGWLLCDGSAVSRTTYAALFAVLGTVYGAGNGSTTFNLPDLRGRVPAGKDDMGGAAANRLTTAGSGVDGAALGATGGAEQHTLSAAQMPAHTHSTTFSWDTGIAGGGQRDGLVLDGSTVISGQEAFNTSSQGSGQAHNNTQPTLVANYIIKT